MSARLGNPIVLFDRAYWTRIVDFDALLENEMITPECVALFDFADSAAEAWEKLVARGLSAHTQESPVTLPNAAR